MTISILRNSLKILIYSERIWIEQLKSVRNDTKLKSLIRRRFNDLQMNLSTYEELLKEVEG